MLLNYLKLSLRLMLRNPFFTLINVVGLSVGFASFFALWQYASSELRADQYHPNHERIARLGIHWRWTDDHKTWGYIRVSWFDPQTANRIGADFPEVESSVRILFQPDFSEKLLGHSDKIILSTENDHGGKLLFKETKGAYADPNLFDFFSIPLRYGDKRDVLREPNTIVLSETLALKYFGNVDPTGRLLNLNGQTELKVTGVFKDLPSNTHLDFDFVLSNVSRVDRWNVFNWPCTQSYVRLRPGVDFKEFENKIESRKGIYLAELFKARPNVKVELWVQPLDEVAFSNNYYGDTFVPKSKSTLVLFSVVSVVILLMAWVNYINLTLARTSKRMKEVATRKMSGAQSLDFIKQFFTESTLINLVSLVLALTILQVVRVPAELTLSLRVSDLSSLSPQSIGFFTLVVLTGTTITGLYPALMAVKYNPRKLISLNARRSRSNFLSGILTTFQYTSAIVLLLCVVVVYLQLSFIFHKGTGIGKDSIAIIEAPILKSDNFTQELETFKDLLISKGLVHDATLANSVVGDDMLDDFGVKRRKDGEDMFLTSNGGVSENYLDFFGIQLLVGRNFKPGDQDVILVTPVGLSRLGFDRPEDALGERINITHSKGTIIHGWKEAEIIGVIEDYHYKPFINNAEINTEYRGHGICLTYKNILFEDVTPERLAIKLDPKNLRTSIPEIEERFKETFPGNPFVFYFQDDHINRHYNNERTSRNQIVFFTLLAIGIACLGLLGMISNKLAEKTKEIGVRKVLGAQIRHIAQVLMSSTVLQVIVANLIGVPVAFYLTQQYLERFSERIALHWWHYATPVAMLLLIMFLTIASVLFKAARTNPIESLRYE